MMHEPNRHPNPPGLLTIVVVSERAAGTEDGRPRLADDLGPCGDSNRVRDDIDTGVEEDDLAARPLRCVVNKRIPHPALTRARTWFKTA